MPEPRPLAYLVNRYPAVSHSFIRREIRAHVAAGRPVVRFSIRDGGQLADPDDRDEATKTTVLLAGGVKGLLGPVLSNLLKRPGPWCSALKKAVAMGRRNPNAGVVKHLVYLAEACALAKHVEAQGVGHLHAHFGTNPAAVARLTHTLTGIPYSFTAHGPEEFDGPHALSLKEKSEDAAFVVAISSFGRSQLYRWLDAEHWDKVVEVHCGLDPVFFEPGAVTDVPDASSNRRFVCVGRLCEQKGQLLLCRAVAELKRRGFDGELVLVGDGDMRPQVEALIDAEGIGDRVTITGWASAQEVRDHLRAARAMVLPSFAEGLPVVIMEALAMGRPVVSTYVAGIPELVDERCGQLVPAGSLDALVGALERVLSADAEQLRDWGRVGAERVRARHDAATEAAKLRATIDGLSAAPVTADSADGAPGVVDAVEEMSAVPAAVGVAQQDTP